MLQSHLQRCQAHLPSLLQRYLPPSSPHSPLAQAMHYACLNGGKRLRPLLIYATAEMFGASWQQVDPLAAAIEFIHCYSLIHDDLPAMDNDDFRRGKPTCHKVFGEGTTILAGNALLTLAFEILAQPNHFPGLGVDQLLQILHIFTQATGASGMVYGQALDLEAEKQQLSLEKLIEMHLAKTGALINASVQCGALGSGSASKDDLAELQKYGEAIGLCFQIQDDILDELGDSQTMGKQAGQDAKNHKCTFVTVLGLESARQYAQFYYQQALSSLERFGNKAMLLRALAHYMIERVA